MIMWSERVSKQNQKCGKVQSFYIGLYRDFGTGTKHNIDLGGYCVNIGLT